VQLDSIFATTALSVIRSALTRTAEITGFDFRKGVPRGTPLPPRVERVLVNSLTHPDGNMVDPGPRVG
jgi:hypothetical protein